MGLLLAGELILDREQFLVAIPWVLLIFCYDDEDCGTSHLVGEDLGSGGALQPP